jgi:acetyltransferase
MTNARSSAADPVFPSASVVLRDGAKVTIRPIRPEDEPLMVELHGRLSDRSVYMRYFSSLSLEQRTAHERLSRVCHPDPQRELVLVADYVEPVTGKHHILGVGRLLALPIEEEAEATVLVADEHQSKGLGTQLVLHLLRAARAQKLRRVNAEILRDNLAIRKMCEKLGIRVHFRLGSEPGSVKAFLDLEGL